MALQAKHIQPVIMSAVMACLMTGFVTWLNLGLTADFLSRWLHAFALSWPVACAAAFLAIPVSVRLTGKILACLNRPQGG